MPNDIKHMEFAHFNFYPVSSTVFTVRITTMIYPGNTDTEGRTQSRAVTVLEVWLIKGHSSGRAGILFQFYSLWNYALLMTK